MKNSRPPSSKGTPPPAPPRIRVLLVDDHPITRQGLRALIGQHERFEICGEADGAHQAMEVFGRTKPDVMIADITLRTTNGIELIKNLKALAPGLIVLVVSMHDENIYAERALRAGAQGYLMKHEASEQIITALERIVRGELYLSERIKEKILHRFAQGRAKAMESPIDTLSDREMEVFQLIGGGHSTRQIADRLCLSTKTIDSYREHLKLKLGLDGGAELVRHAIQWSQNQGVA